MERLSVKRLVLGFVAATLVLSGCSSAAPRQASTPEPSSTASPPLREVTPSTPDEKALVAAFVKTRGNGVGGVAPIRNPWSRISAQELPPQFTPSDTLGRGLLTALEISSRPATSSALGSPVAIEMLFEHGLVVSAAMDRRVARDSRSWTDAASKAVSEADPNFSTIETATVDGTVALVRVGSALSGFTKKAANVEWVIPPWRYSVELADGNASSALRVARSVGR